MECSVNDGTGRFPEHLTKPPRLSEENTILPFGSQHGSNSFHGPLVSWRRPVPSMLHVNTW